MPINRKDFDNGNFKTRHDDKESHPVSVLLRKNSNLAFNVKEISKRTKMKDETVRSMLKSLKEMGLVVHKQPYFAWKKVEKKVKKQKAKRKK